LLQKKSFLYSQLHILPDHLPKLERNPPYSQIGTDAPKFYNPNEQSDATLLVKMVAGKKLFFMTIHTF
jgi:hypothetical protein